MSREDDIAIVVRSVFRTTVDFYDNPNGGYEFSCPFCFAKVIGGHDLYERWVKMEDLKHHSDCVYLVAKDLMTGIDAERDKVNDKSNRN